MSSIDNQVDLVMKNIHKLSEKAVNKVVAVAATKLFTEIVTKTPIDSGKARRDWQIDYGNGYRSPGLKLKIDINSYKIGTDIHIKNDNPYMQKLEYGGYGQGPKTTGGFSTQAPQGMVRISLKMFNRFINQAAATHKI